MSRSCLTCTFCEKGQLFRDGSQGYTCGKHAFTMKESEMEPCDRYEMRLELRKNVDWEAFDKEMGEDELRKLSDKADWFDSVMYEYGSLDAYWREKREREEKRRKEEECRKAWLEPFLLREYGVPAEIAEDVYLDYPDIGRVYAYTRMVKDPSGRKVIPEDIKAYYRLR